MGDDDRPDPGQTPHAAAGEPGPSNTHTDRRARGRDAPFDPRRPQVSLTRRERQVVRLIAQGLSNRQIAERLTLSVRTVERHVENIYNRLGCSGKAGRTIATAYAIRHGLTDCA